jgi:PAS domain S-box-containing protein
MLHGFAFQYVWPKLPWFNEKLWVISMNVALAFGGIFTTSLLGLKQQSPLVHRTVIGLALMAIANAILSLIIAYRTAINITVGISLTICIVCLVVGCIMWSRNYTPARYYSIAWVGLLVGTVVFVLAKLGFIARTLITENAMQAGSSIEVVLLSFALANRINVARREKELAQAEALSMLQKYQALYENAIEGIFQITHDCLFRDANRAMITMLGVDSREVLLHPTPMHLREFFAEADEADRFCWQLRNQHQIITYEFRGKNKRGREFWASLSVRTNFVEGDEPSYYEGSLVDVTGRHRAEERARILAYYDHVTGLPNRAFLYEQIKHALVRAKRNNALVAVLFVDLDRFKLVNDILGHDTGDQLLREFAARLTDSLRGDDWVARPRTAPSDTLATDTVARLGGDEFVMVLSEIRQVEDAAVVSKRIAELLSRPFELEGKEVYITASIGISVYPVDGEAPAELLKNADAAMYYAKKQGKNSYQFYARYINEQTSKRLSLETKLRHALHREQFQLHYQPKVDLQSGRISGIEALCRWPQSERAPVPPSEFIPLAEESGLILGLGEWVLRVACAQNKAWQNAGLPNTRISVNLSVRQFQDPNLVRTVRRILRHSGMEATYLELEITGENRGQNTVFTNILVTIRDNKSHGGDKCRANQDLSYLELRNMLYNGVITASLVFTPNRIIGDTCMI